MDDGDGYTKNVDVCKTCGAKASWCWIWQKVLGYDTESTNNERKIR